MTFVIAVTSPELQIRVQQQQKRLLLTEFANYHKEHVKPALQEKTSDQLRDA